jgi:hypothetical protein
VKLNLSPNLNNPDAVYADLIAAHKGRSPEDSAALNARLLLILMNHVGNRQILTEALSVAASQSAAIAQTS